MSGPEGYFRYWGKADPNYKEEPKWHPLVYHCLDVAAVAAAWWEESGAVRRAFISAFNAQPHKITTLRAWVLFFISLHDIGKFDVRFQLKSVEALRECWSELNLNDVDTAPRVTEKYDHGQAGFAWAAVEYRQWTANSDEDFEGWNVWMPWLAAVTGHHGDISENTELNPPDGEPYVAQHDVEARGAWIKALSELFLRPYGISLSELPPSCERATKLLLAGFCSISDWIGSNQDEFAYTQPTADYALYYNSRLKEVKNKRLLKQVGLTQNPALYTGITALLERSDRPRGVQVVIDDLRESPGLTIIEAPTGSGKTEAALAYAWRLLENARADSIIFALPTQATANAMLKRVEKFAEQVFGNGGANLVLAHGKRDYNPDFQRLIKAGEGKTAQGKEEGATQCTLWLSQSRKRVFLGQIGICTVDQVLLSVLPVRHKFVRGFGLSKSVLIVDEVHAYDNYMHGLLSEVLRRQRAAGGSVVLLSATLPSSARTLLLEAWQNTETPLDDYPLVTHVSEEGLQAIKVPHNHRPEQYSVSIERLSMPSAFPDEDLLLRIITAARGGARIAFICNLVDDAQRVSFLVRGLLKDANIPVDVFHARYQFFDRQEKEKTVMKLYGKNAPRGSGRILVATQVIEQSLDLDVDLMITQICPVDLLLQRLGRLHRHKQARPRGFEKPLCIVITVQDCKYGLHKEIYGNARVLWRTESLLKGASEITFPDVYRDWVDSVYERDDWADEPEEISLEYAAFSALENHKRSDAEKLTSMTMSQFRDEDDRITSLTRDSEMNLIVVPIQTGRKFLDGMPMATLDDKMLLEALALNGIPVPAGWEKYLHDCECDEDGRYILEMVFDGHGWIHRKGKNIFRYTQDFGLEKRRE